MLLEQAETRFVLGSHFDDFVNDNSLRTCSVHFLPELSGDDDLMIERQDAIERFEVQEKLVRDQRVRQREVHE